MKEYVIHFQLGNKWIFLRDYLMCPLLTEKEAKREMEERKEDHPWNNYRVVVRTVSEWKEV